MKSSYWKHIRGINRNSRLYFTNTFIVGISSGITHLLFNYYLLSLDYSQSFIGSLVSILNFSSMVATFPASFIVNRISPRSAFFIGFLVYGVSALMYTLYPTQVILYAMHAICGIASSLFMVAYRPFLFENSTHTNRSHLFSLDSTLAMVSSIIGSFAGGFLPTVFARLLSTSNTSPQAYKFALLVGVGVLLAGIIPIIFMRTPKQQPVDQTASKNPRLSEMPAFFKLVAPNLLISIGAGLLMPFINIFYRMNYGQSDFVVGRMMALGSLAMGIGLFLSPIFANRIGKLNLVIISQTLSIPFLLIMGFASDFNLSALGYLIRLALMNMSLPIYDVLLLELVGEKKRTILSGLLNITQNIGWSLGPFISGFIQESLGFSVLFISTSLLYISAIILNLLVIKKIEPVASIQ